jgi:hypothetical protein
VKLAALTFLPAPAAYVATVASGSPWPALIGASVGSIPGLISWHGIRSERRRAEATLAALRERTHPNG